MRFNVIYIPSSSFVIKMIKFPFWCKTKTLHTSVHLHNTESQAATVAVGPRDSRLVCPFIHEICCGHSWFPEDAIPMIMMTSVKVPQSDQIFHLHQEISSSTCTQKHTIVCPFWTFHELSSTDQIVSFVNKVSH